MLNLQDQARGILTVCRILLGRSDNCIVALTLGLLFKIWVSRARAPEPESTPGRSEPRLEIGCCKCLRAHKASRRTTASEVCRASRSAGDAAGPIRTTALATKRQ